jgi:hypothetical protein
MPISFFSTDWIFHWVQSPTWWLVILLVVNVLWIPLIWWLIKEMWAAWLEQSQTFFAMKRQFVVLAIDVPRDIEQTPLGMEAVFNQLAGAHGSTTWWEEKWEGAFQEWFSFEIISIDGYVQYVIRCHKDFRDLVEASVYAQYPDAEITEVRDYVNDIPKDWPNDEWEMFGTEYNLAKPSAYPIRVYREFEDKVRGEFLDPLAGLLEIMSKMQKGEQIWYQILAKPIVDPDWVPAAQQEIDALVEKAGPDSGPSIFQKVMSVPAAIISGLTTAVFPDSAVEASGPKREGPRTNVMSLTPGERTLVEEMERKITKLAYNCRIRIAYVAKKDVFSKARGVGPVIGAVKQFNDGTRNFFKVSKKSWTKANYALKKARVSIRQSKFVNAYASRNISAGEAVSGYILNTEELATIYHFPLASVKAPLLKRTGARKSEPPATLPIDLGETTLINIPNRVEPSEVPKPASTEPEDAVFGTPTEYQGSVSAPSTPLPTADKGVTFVDIPDEDESPQPPNNLPTS